MASTIEIFYSYAHEDEKLRNKLEQQLALLQRTGQITNWHDRKINPGREWANEIDANLNKAQIILLLVSPAFLASDYCYGVEVKKAMDRHECGEARVIPIILRRVHWEDAPFGKIQALPTDGIPVTSRSWYNRDEAFFDIARGIRKVVKELKEKDASFSLIKKSGVNGEYRKENFANAQILLVEDATTRIRVVETALKRHNPRYSLTTVSDGAEALIAVKKRSYDLMILDLGLPEVGGLEVIRKLRREGNDISILIVSGAAFTVIAKGLALGADDYIQSPFKTSELIERIDAFFTK